MYILNTYRYIICIRAAKKKTSFQLTHTHTLTGTVHRRTVRKGAENRIRLIGSFIMKPMRVVHAVLRTALSKLPEEEKKTNTKFAYKNVIERTEKKIAAANT